MYGCGGVVGFQRLGVDIIIRCVWTNQRIVRVVDVENGRTVFAFQSQRQFGPVIVPGNIHRFDGDVRIHLRVGLNHLVDRIRVLAAPAPVFELDWLAVVHEMIGVVGDGVADNVKPFVGFRIGCAGRGIAVPARS